MIDYRIHRPAEDTSESLHNVPGPGVAAAALVGEGHQSWYTRVGAVDPQEAGGEVGAGGVLRPPEFRRAIEIQFSVWEAKIGWSVEVAVGAGDIAGQGSEIEIRICAQSVI